MAHCRLTALLMPDARKSSIAEDPILNQEGGSYVKKYIIRGDFSRQDSCRFANDEISFGGSLDVMNDGNALSYDFCLERL